MVLRYSRLVLVSKPLFKGLSFVLLWVDSRYLIKTGENSANTIITEKNPAAALFFGSVGDTHSDTALDFLYRSQSTAVLMMNVLITKPD